MLYLCLISVSIAEEKTYWDMFVRFEDIIRYSDIICTGTVLENLSDGTETNKTSIQIKEIINSHKKISDILTVETIALPKYYAPQKFDVGSTVLLFLSEKNNNYRLYADPYCNFKIVNGYIEGCNVSASAFVDEIKSVLGNKGYEFSLQFPSYYANDITNKNAKALKIADINTYSLNDYEFRADDDYTSSFRTIHFYVNPTGAKDATGASIPDSILIMNVASCCSLWNVIDDTNIYFTVDSTVTGTTGNRYDGISVIWFDPTLDDGWALYKKAYNNYNGCDISFDADWKWSLWNQSLGDSCASFIRTLTHELGHAVGLKDFGRPSDPYSYNDNIMWHSWDGMDLSVMYPQNGDKAGAVYLIPDIRGELVFDEIWSGRSDSSDPLNINSNITVGDDDTLIIESGDHVLFDIGAGIDVEGRLVIQSDVTFDKSNISDWDGIDIKNGGTLELEGTLNIHNAYEALHFESGSTLTKSDATRINIYDSDSYAVRITNFSPSIKNIYKTSAK